MSARTQRWLHQAADIWLGEFRCPPGHPAWTRTNRIGDQGPLIAIPRTAVRIEHEGRPAVVADPSRAVAYHAGQPYRRELVSPEGDRCSFIAISPQVAAEAASGLDGAADDPSTYRFPFSSATILADEYLLHERVRHLAGNADAPGDAMREALYWLVSRVVRRGYSADLNRPIRRSATARDHSAAVESVRGVVGRDLGERLSLDELAQSVYLSPFHLSRVFRERTGMSIHRYRTDVRLRASLERIADGVALADIAAELGFASQAHLTDRFRRAYGLTPGEWRLTRRRSAETSRIMEAAQGAARIA